MGNLFRITGGEKMIFKVLEESAETIKQVLLKKNTNDEIMKEATSALEKKGYMVNLLNNDYTNKLFLEFQKKGYVYRFKNSYSGFQLNILNISLDPLNIKHEVIKQKEKYLNQLGYTVSYKKNDFFGLDFKI